MSLLYPEFHFECLNITSGYYYINKLELNKSGRCPFCENISRRVKNDNTPIRKSLQPTFGDTTMSIDKLESNLKHLILINKLELDNSNNTKNKHYALHLNQQTRTQIALNENTKILDQVGFLLDK